MVEYPKMYEYVTRLMTQPSSCEQVDDMAIL